MEDTGRMAPTNFSVLYPSNSLFCRGMLQEKGFLWDQHLGPLCSSICIYSRDDSNRSLSGIRRFCCTCCQKILGVTSNQVYTLHNYNPNSNSLYKDSSGYLSVFLSDHDVAILSNPLYISFSSDLLMKPHYKPPPHQLSKMYTHTSLEFHSTNTNYYMCIHMACAELKHSHSEDPNNQQ